MSGSSPAPRAPSRCGSTQGTLLEAIDYTDAIRHARDVGELKRPYVDALLELDHHPARLQVMDQLQEPDWGRK